MDIENLNWITRSILLHETVGHIKYEVASNLENNKFLEIGFGDGLFLEYMKEREWDVYGIEISQDCVNRLKRRRIKNVYSEDIFSCLFNNENFDLIRMSHTLEHMHNPFGVLTEVKRILKKSGRLVIRVPNFNSYCQNLFKQYAYFLHLPFHLYFFYLETLEKLIDEVGELKIVKVHQTHSFILYIASIIQFLRINQENVPHSTNFSVTKLVICRLIDLVSAPFMNIFNLFKEGDVLEVEIVKIHNKMELLNNSDY
jgi:2-polyprenyl-3-methyl-5-hydroxy-6-metoxy-1,4-benzoquinol methylase